MPWLKQSTTVTIQVGPFLDSTDGVTAETGLAGSMTVSLSKANAAFGARSSATAIAYDTLGFYRVELNTTDTGTLGRLVVASSPSGAVPVWHEFDVMPANTFDSLAAATDKLEVDAVQWTGTNVATPATAGYPVVTNKVGTGAGELSLSSGVIAADTTKWNGTAVATPATAGYPAVTVKSGTGTGELSVTSGVVAANTTTIGNTAIDSILDRAVTEPSSVFTWPASLRTIAQFLGALARNKITQTTTTQTLRNDADSGTIASSTQSDDGTTFTRGEFS